MELVHLVTRRLSSVLQSTVGAMVQSPFCNKTLGGVELFIQRKH